jgi:hypothetical protein
VKIRQGRRNGLTLYLQMGDEPSDLDPSIGFTVEPGIAEVIERMSTERDEYHEEHMDEIRRIVTAP